MIPGGDEVAMDRCHMELITALAATQKPKAILELGYGSGRLTRFLLEAVNRYGMDCKHTLVDSWLDWGGEPPMDIADLEDRVQIITMAEKNYVREHLEISDYRWDLIISDADHHHSHEWAMEVYDKMLNPGGILIYHDVDGTYPGLAALPDQFKVLRSAAVKVFNASSLPTERCHRGLLVVFKPEESREVMHHQV